MLFDATTLSQIVAPLAMLFLLAFGYGRLRRLLPGTALAPVLLGALFGGVSIVQMNLPIEPTPGLIIDLRNIPILLAGAFLGPRGTVVAILMAAVTRLNIGGVGAVSGVCAMMISGAVGLLWDRMTRGSLHRSLRSFVGLAVMFSLHLFGVLLLPFQTALWFLLNAAPWILGMNLLVTPVIASLLERERILMLREGRVRRSVSGSRKTMFLSPDALAVEMAQCAGAVTYRSGVDLLAIRLRRGSVIATFWGPEAEAHVTRAMHQRLKAVLPPSALIGLIRDDLILICVPRLAIPAGQNLARDVHSALTSQPVRVPGMASVRLRLSIDHIRLDHLPTLTGVFEIIGLPDRIWQRQAGVMPRVEGLHAPESGTARLFDIADRLLEIKAAAPGDRSADPA